MLEFDWLSNNNKKLFIESLKLTTYISIKGSSNHRQIFSLNLYQIQLNLLAFWIQIHHKITSSHRITWLLKIKFFIIWIFFTKVLSKTLHIEMNYKNLYHLSFSLPCRSLSFTTSSLSSSNWSLLLCRSELAACNRWRSMVRVSICSIVFCLVLSSNCFSLQSSSNAFFRRSWFFWRSLFDLALNVEKFAVT